MNDEHDEHAPEPLAPTLAATDHDMAVAVLEGRQASIAERMLAMERYIEALFRHTGAPRP